MLKSRAVANWNPSNFKSKSWIFGIGKGYLLILLFSSLRSVKNLIVPSFLGMTKQGAAHCEWLTFSRTPILHKRSTSTFNFQKLRYHSIFYQSSPPFFLLRFIIFSIGFLIRSNTPLCPSSFYFIHFM